ncbi:polysaccharide biosynthesis C-terminal domain-containing protein [[Clostridium] symbiosum]|uniref:oligosaccharide flippase family protein n=1 Tax=Clostridium symbiosum TaxID=1512 RepID=UPI001D066A13|nr:polysaccharide biosynthesis C-terminal domain-containing protein [[Clostridium] symbiosum]MCB6607719.1 polysaccharide biosynthesis C-terminal domain-containing protein [[Clostridium] symbiosum]MCB6932580.1 polysaccharide biosynthesis C-terminal domain-containing protein [[Clostridium] symbiosum]
MAYNSKKKARYLVGNIGLFMIATFLPKTLTFFMVPLYTSCLSTVEYGAADMLTNTVSLLMPVLTLQIQDAVMRYALKEDYSKEDVLSVGVKITLTGGGLLIILLIVLVNINIVTINIYFLFFLCLNYFTGSLNNVLAYFCRGINKIKIITISSILNSLLTIGCNLLFLLVLHWGLNGYLIANSVGAAVRVLYIFFGAQLYKKFTWKNHSKNIANDMISFSIPMIFSALSWWINNASDKYILTIFKGVSIVGIYAIASKIPSILAAFGEVIAKSFSISAIKEFDSNDTDGFLGKSYGTISFCMVFICSLIMILNENLAKIMFAKEFYAAWKYVPLLLVSIMFNQLSLSCENILLGVGKTSIISKTALMGACINTFLNFILIPIFGAYGAACATAFGFFLTWVIRYQKVILYVKLKNSIRKEIISYFLITIQMVLACFGHAYLFIQIVILGLMLNIYFEELKKIVKFVIHGWH